MENGNAESKDRLGNETKSGAAPENVHTIKLSLPILTIIKGLYDACGLEMYGPPENSGIPELPQWAKNICEQLRLTIFKRVLELQPQGGEMDWRNFGRTMGLCQRLAVYLKKCFAETDFKPAAASSELSDASRPILVPPKDLLNQVEDAFRDSIDAALAQSSENQLEFLSGLTEGYELFLDARGQFSGDRGRTTVYFELLSRWQEIEALRQSKPPLSRLQLYQLFAPSLGDSKLDRLAWFKDVCDDIGLIMKERGRPFKSLGN